MEEKRMEKNIWMDGIFGVVTGDALGCPVEFADREMRKADPVLGMREYGTFNLPMGSWTDDSSLTLAALAGIAEKKEVNLDDIMNRFVDWLQNGAYTPFDQAFDVGHGTMQAVMRYAEKHDVKTCGGTTSRDNGNGSLMRIMPFCLYCYEQEMSGALDRKKAIRLIHDASALTHNHIRSQIACGLYYFMIVSILEHRMDSEKKLPEILQEGITNGRAFYESIGVPAHELQHYERLWNLDSFGKLEEDAIRSSGYVVDTIEAAVWSLVTTATYRDCTLKAVNLGLDTDTVAAIAGGLAGLYYGVDGIPADWMQVIQRREWICELCMNAAN